MSVLSDYARPLIIDLPLPPSVNRYGAGRLGNSSSVVQAWRKRCNFHLMTSKLRPATLAIHGKYVIHIVWDDDTPRCGDIGHRIQPLLDYLHDIGLTADDSQCEGLSACYGTAPEGCRVRLLGYPANDNGGTRDGAKEWPGGSDAAGDLVAPRSGHRGGALAGRGAAAEDRGGAAVGAVGALQEFRGD